MALVMGWVGAEMPSSSSSSSSSTSATASLRMAPGGPSLVAGGAAAAAGMAAAAVSAAVAVPPPGWEGLRIGTSSSLSSLSSSMMSDRIPVVATPTDATARTGAAAVPSGEDSSSNLHSEKPSLSLPSAIASRRPSCRAFCFGPAFCFGAAFCCWPRGKPAILDMRSSISLDCCMASGSTNGPGASAPCRSARAARSTSSQSAASRSLRSCSNKAADGSISVSSSGSSPPSPSTSSIRNLPRARAAPAAPALAAAPCPPAAAALSAASLTSRSRSMAAQRRCSFASLLCGSRERTTSKSERAAAGWCSRRRAIPRRR
mmetsp:Transcript_29924/g.95363  ORF Transcript_29924/g.95363 Transcript_29924/m.95363 type:complete len:317 (-) Transcript_29924:843-1793(-)